MGNKYIDIIIKIIARKANEYSIDHNLSPAYFNELLPQIREAIVTVVNMYGYPEIDDLTLQNYYETAKNQFLSVNPIDIEPCSSLTKRDFRTWLDNDRKESMKDSWHYSDRYFSYLEKIGRSEKIIDDTRNTSLEILGKMGDPKSKETFFVRGLVVGSVQAGKTQNFNAVINRAIDSGYALIIVLAGLMEDLRFQTQVRIENDVIGEGIKIDNDTLVTKGVGTIRRFGNLGDNSVTQVISRTSSKSDFKKSLLDAEFSLNHTNILVCKKNISVLRNLIVWLHDYLEENKDQHNIPMLVIDDEADNASLNNEGKRGREYSSRINGHIRVMLELFKRKTYLGYTATPFANVLADRNEAPENNYIIKYRLRGLTEEKSLPQVSNLFPEDFIVLLNAPTNYIGAKHIFETIIPIENKAQMKIPLVELVNDNVENFPGRVYQNEHGELIGVERISNSDEWQSRFDQFGSYLDFNSYKDYRRDTRTSKPYDDFPRYLPDSLKESIQCFILSIAVRESRKPAMINSVLYNRHHSMLIHISRFTLWQNRLKGLIASYIKELQSSVKSDNPKNPNSIFTSFEKTWYKYFSFLIEQIMDFLPKGYEDEFLVPISFDTIKNTFLVDAVKDIEVKAVNSLEKDQLVYPENTSRKYIAIGGNRLSRGFTLEGLTINYFVRYTDYLDALLQMGRWFGYRPGYLDCCRLFITNDLMNSYDMVTRTIEELEVEFKKMDEKEMTPRNFILRVKKHPGTLKITRPAILKDTLSVNWSYQDELEQTVNFDVRKEKIEKVWSDFRNITIKDFKFKKTNNDNGVSSGFLTAETDIPGIIKLLELENNFGSVTCQSIIQFIKLCKEKNKLSRWTIAIKTTGNANPEKGKGFLETVETGLPRIQMTIRRGPENNPSSKKYHDKFRYEKVFGVSGKSANLISSGLDLAILLSNAQIEEAKLDYYDKRKEDYRKKYPLWTDEKINEAVEKINPPERIYREKMSDQEGLLLIYILDSYYVFRQERGEVGDPDFKKLIDIEKIDLNIPLIGYAIGFPPIEPDPGGVYVYGNYGLEELDVEDLNDDDAELPIDAKTL